MQVRKRDGRIVRYDGRKIYDAIARANAEVDIAQQMSDSDIRMIVFDVEEEFGDCPLVDVETIQDHIEDRLMAMGYFELARTYIRYRYKRMLVRKSNSTDESILSLIRGQNKELDEENSNKNTRIASTQRDYIAGEVSRDVSKRLLLPEHIVKAHEDGVLHFHDMDYFIQPIFNCCLIDIGDMLDNGTVINGKMIETPKSFRTACTIMTQIIACIASNQYGGQSVDIKHLGKYLRRSAEKVRTKLSTLDVQEDEREFLFKTLLHDELSAGVQTIQYQINTLMTTNGQSPFVTLFLNLEEDDEYAEETAMIIKEILYQRHLGIKNESGVYVTPAFPKLVYVLHDHNCLNGGKYDEITKLAVMCSSKRMYPDYISAKKMKENYQGNVFSPMGCRSFLSPWKDENGEYKFEGRFNQGVVSINLPQIGLMCEGDEDKFWKLLDRRLELCYEALMCRHEALKKVTSDVSPIHWQHGAIARLPKHASIEPLLYGGYSSISLGYIGLYELTRLVRGCSHTDPAGEEFALDVMKYLKAKVEEWKAKTNIGFALYGTPAESLCYRFAEIDKKKFGEIPDITDKGYYTNSYHVDVREEIDAFNKFKFESQFQSISTGGCISYCEIPNVGKNIPALEQMVRFIYDNIQYAEFNTKSDYCQVCGFDGEIVINDQNQWECPQCHNTDKTKMNVTRRTCGYLGENYWNEGKTKEIKSRVLHLN
jgi:ribonucleoside-triphosphate reductase